MRHVISIEIFIGICLCLCSRVFLPNVFANDIRPLKPYTNDLSIVAATNENSEKQRITVCRLSKEGNPQGECRWYYPNSALKACGVFDDDGYPVNNWMYYFTNGTLAVEQNTNGIWRVFYSNGILRESTSPDAGGNIVVERFYESGNRSARFLKSDGGLSVKFMELYTTNGILRLRIDYDDKCNPIRASEWTEDGGKLGEYGYYEYIRSCFSLDRLGVVQVPLNQLKAGLRTGATWESLIIAFGLPMVRPPATVYQGVVARCVWDGETPVGVRPVSVDDDIESPPFLGCLQGWYFVPVSDGKLLPVCLTFSEPGGFLIGFTEGVVEGIGSSGTEKIENSDSSL
jgi:hypothetical protein